jgi:nitrate reductase NapD
MPVIADKTASPQGIADELHIAGIVVQARPESLPAVCQAIGEFPGAEVHAVSEHGKLIVTLEGHHASEVVAQLNAIRALPGVYSVALVYQRNEDIEWLNEELVDESDPPRVH